MTDAIKQIEKALDNIVRNAGYTSPDYDAHKAIQDKKKVKAALSALQKIASGGAVEDAYSDVLRNISEEHIEIINGDSAFQSMQSTLLQDYQIKGAYMMFKEMQKHIAMLLEREMKG